MVVNDAPSPEEIYNRGIDDGRRRLNMPLLEKSATGFIAGVTIVFGVVALGIVYAAVEPTLGTGLAELLGSLAFGIGLIFLVVGRTELFSENFFGPVVATAQERDRRAWVPLVTLWLVILALNLVGGIVLAALLTVEGGLPDGTPEALSKIADEIVAKSAAATFVRALAAGALLTLLSYMLHACDSVASRIGIAFIVGFFVAIGPFDHVVVSALHLLFGMWFEASVTYADIATNIGISSAGNVTGGVVLVTLTHMAQVKGHA